MDKKILEMIDACRPQAVADLAEPELAPLRETLEHDAKAREAYERLARVDEAMREIAAGRVDHLGGQRETPVFTVSGDESSK